MVRDDAGRRYVDSEMAALEQQQADTDQLASLLETQLRAVMLSGASRFLVVICPVVGQLWLSRNRVFCYLAEYN